MKHKKLWLFILFFVALVLGVVEVQAVLYDDFEGGSLNTSLWDVTNNPAVSADTANNGSQSVKLYELDVITSKLIPFSGSTLLSFWIYEEKAAITDDIEINLKISGTDCMRLDGGHPTAQYWGYYQDAGWKDSNVSSTNGDGDVSQTWGRLRILVNHTDDTLDLLWGNGTSPQVEKLPIYGAGCTAETMTELVLKDISNADNAYVYFDMVQYWNATAYGWEGAETEEPTPTEYFEILASNLTFGGNITVFNATVNGTNFNTTNGRINTTYTSTSGNYNINVSAPGFYSGEWLNYNSNVTLNATLVTTNGSVTYSGHFIYNSTHNYTRNLNYSYTVTNCYGSSNTLQLYINGTVKNTTNVDCSSGNVTTVTGTYAHGAEVNYNISFTFNGTSSYDVSISNTSFYADINNPVVDYLNSSFAPGFQIGRNTTISLRCTDQYNNISNNLTINAVQLYYGYNESNASISNLTILPDGTVTVIAICSDPFGSTNETLNFTAYAKNILLLDEIDSVAFDVKNVTNAKMWFDDNSTYYDFKYGNTTNITTLSNINSKLRIELEYPDGTLITRYIDLSLVDEENMTVCANKDGITHYEQLIVAATQREVVAKNIYNDCYIVADYTRFAYQDSLVVKAYTIDSLYYLYTYDGGSQTLLASVDGSIQTYINLDTLEFQRTGYDLDILGDSLTFEKEDNNTMKIYYTNLNDDNLGLTATITRLDTNSLVLNTSDFTDPNTFTLYFDFSTLSNVTNKTHFQITLTKTTASAVSTLSRYFTTQASSGYIPAVLAFVLSLFTAFFGLTFAVSRITFSWFGLFIMLASIAITAFSVSTWYIIMLQAIEVIIAVYIVIIMVQQNYATVT